MAKIKNPFKRQQKNKPQILADQKMAQEARRKRDFILEKFFPFLVESAGSIHQAKQICKIFQNDVMSTFNEGMRKPLSTLDLMAKTEGWTDDASQAFKKLIEMFSEMTIAETLEIIGGMPQAIEGAMAVEERQRSMEELEWDDGAMKVKPHGRANRLKKALAEASCNDVRMLSNGVWVAYSTKVNEEEIAVRASGNSIDEAVDNLASALRK